MDSKPGRIATFSSWMTNKMARIAWAVLSSGEDYRPYTAEIAAA
jgi:hypothetical protein